MASQFNHFPLPPLDSFTFHSEAGQEMNFLELNPSSITVLLVLLHIPICSGSEELWYESCGNYFNCGNITNIGFPFWGESRPNSCGYPGLELKCEEKNITIMEISDVEYRVLDIDPDDQLLRIVRDNFMERICFQTFTNTTLDYTLFDYDDHDSGLTIYYGCPPLHSSDFGEFTCSMNGVHYTNVYVETGAQGPDGCNASVVVPTLSLADEMGRNLSLPQIIGVGFEVKYKVDSADCGTCTARNGRCGYDLAANSTTCICPGQKVGYEACGISHPTSATVPAKTSTSRKTVLIAGITVAVVAALLLGCCGFFILLKRNPRMSYAKSKEISAPHNGLSPSSDLFSTNGSATTTTISNSQNVPLYSPSKSDIEKGSTYFGVKVFSYAELEQATNNFDESRELGDGGFGVVYYGELPDGRPVAVKRLFENNITRAGQFNNEIEILAHLRHKNLVTLYGCSSRRSRELLLVYEYIPNGTVADHLHGKLVESGLLTWPIRLNIAVETADALAYLHASDVIHRDVKTTNVLLDKNFEVKVADFGLSRLFPSDVTHVSTAPQGTPGYVDPEYYQVYRLTEKSDVYSFGVVLIELISSKRAMDPFRPRLDINLANMAIDRIQNQKLHELVDPCLGFDRDNTVRDMIKLVAELAFKCLQQQRDLRPSMVEVVEVLRGIQKTMSSAEKQVEMEIKEDDDVGS
ncbi:hypothetical protein Ancab_006345 [Ancistrocladus abbreviatus]